MQTARLESSSAAMPAARLVSQKRCGPTAVATREVEWRVDVMYVMKQGEPESLL
jgi:hypothetical protein